MSQTGDGWISDLLAGFRQLQVGGVPVSVGAPGYRNILNLLDGSATDNPTNGSVDLSFGAGWQTAYALNFAALPSQTFATDGDYQINGDASGIQWAKFGTVDEAAPLAIVNGQGLVFRPSAAAASGQPIFFTSLLNILPASAQTWTTAIRVDLVFSTLTAGDGLAEPSVGVFDFVTGQGYSLEIDAANGDPLELATSINAGSSVVQSVTADVSATPPLSSSVAVTLEIPGFDSARLQVLAAQSSSLPTDVALRPVVTSIPVVDAGLLWGDPFTGSAWDFGNTVLVLRQASTAWTSTPASWAISALRVRYKQ